MVKIESIRIQNFRSIIDSGTIDIDPKITTLVGPNEAGKTNFLEALQKFQMGESYERDDLSFYIDDSDVDPSRTPIVTMEISDIPLNRLDQRRLRSTLEKQIDDEVDTATIIKYYDGNYEAKLDKHTELIDQINQQREQEIEGLLQQFTDIYRSISDVIEEESAADLDILPPHVLDISARQSYSAEEIRKNVDRFRMQLDTIENEADEEVLSQLQNEIMRAKHNLNRIESGSFTAAQILVDSVYNTAFKEGADLIQDEVAMEVLQDGSTDTFYSDILEFAGIDPENFYEIDSKERYDRKHDAANQLEQGFNEYWPRMDDIGFELSFGGDTVSLHITDESGSTDLATHRSTGFRHFLSFYIRLIAASGNELKDSLLLLDGPGIHLHPAGQKKLKEALENLAADNQVIYSTHSPFMIDANHVERIRILRQDIHEGTQILSDLDEAAQAETDVDVLAPVRTSIGANFADSLFASSANILVEGYTDKRYLEAISELLQRENEGPSIDHNTNIITVGGSKADYLAKILEAEGYEYLILLDSDQAGKDRKESLIGRGIDPERIHMLGESVDRFEDETELTIEDLFSDVFYGEQVAQTHEEIEIDDIYEVLEEDSGNIVENIKGKLQELEGRGSIDVESFSKGNVADLIADRIIQKEFDREDLGDRTIEDFSQLINDLNLKLTR